MWKRRAVQIDDGGNLIISEELRRNHDLEHDVKVVVESTKDGLLLRPLSYISQPAYSHKRQAKLLLSNATDEEDYRRALETVQPTGLNLIPTGLKPEAVSAGRT